MALPDLTGQNIQDTYQRVLQTDDGTIRDGTGSLLISASFQYISASHLDLDGQTLRIGGTFITEDANELQFKSGDNFQPIKARTIDLVSTGSTATSVQISDDGQGFIAVNAEPGKFSTVFRAESTLLSGDQRMGSITQKGSGSFAILLDADQVRGDGKFAVYSNTAVPGVGTQLFSVSESFEVRSYGSLVADTNITASGNISGSYVTTASFGSLQLNNLPTSPTGLPTGSVWVSGSKNDTTTDNVNCGTLMIVL